MFSIHLGCNWIIIGEDEDCDISEAVKKMVCAGRPPVEETNCLKNKHTPRHVKEEVRSASLPVHFWLGSVLGELIIFAIKESPVLFFFFVIRRTIVTVKF